MFEEGRTLGLPVVPLEKQRSASFVFPSPGCRVRSMKVGFQLRPSIINSRTVEKFGNLLLGTGSNKIMRSDRRPATWAAERTVSMKLGWTIMRVALTDISW